MPRSLTTPGSARSAYVHVPFCHTLCGYCDFYSTVYDAQAARPLVDALLRELDRWAETLRPRFETLFVGGGTPTTLAPAELRRLLAALYAYRAAERPLEFTVEANPATVTPRIAAALAEAGVTRVSIGAQSFARDELRVLERIHRPEQVARTVATCRAAGIGEVNLDLIFAIPGQSLDRWLRNLDAALALEPDHLSCYGLTYEHGTRLHAQRTVGVVAQADADLEADMYEATIEHLAASGFAQYEISNFARPGRECRHNLVYWRGENYVGMGPSAAGYVGDRRYKNVPDTGAYITTMAAGRDPIVQEEILDPLTQAREALMLGLRLTKGVDRTAFRARFGFELVERFGAAVERHSGDGLLEVDDEAVRLTRRGLLLADTVIADFLQCPVG